MEEEVARYLILTLSMGLISFLSIFLISSFLRDKEIIDFYKSVEKICIKMSQTKQISDKPSFFQERVKIPKKCELKFNTDNNTIKFGCDGKLAIINLSEINITLIRVNGNFSEGNSYLITFAYAAPEENKTNIVYYS